MGLPQGREGVVVLSDPRGLRFPFDEHAAALRRIIAVGAPKRSARCTRYICLWRLQEIHSNVAFPPLKLVSDDSSGQGLIVSRHERIRGSLQ